MVVSSPSATNSNVDDFTVMGTNLYYIDDIDNVNGSQLFKVALSGGSATLVADLSQDDVWVNQLMVFGGDVYAFLHNDTKSTSEVVKVTAGTTAAPFSLPSGVSANVLHRSGFEKHLHV